MVLGLAGCARVHLYDPSRTATANLAVEQRNSAELDQVSKDAAELLDTLLQSEIDAAAAANKFLFDNDIFRIAASDGGDETLLHWVREIDGRLEALGFKNRAQVTLARDNAIALDGELEKLARAKRDIKLVDPRLSELVPECSVDRPSAWPPAGRNIGEDDRVVLEVLYADFSNDCTNYLNSVEKLKSDGPIIPARIDAERKRNEIAARKSKANAVQQEIQTLKKNVEAATEVGKTPGEELKTAVGELKARIEDAKKIQEQLGVDILSDDTLESIGVVLASLAGEEAPDASDRSAAFHESLAFLSQIPSLADDAAALSARSKQPPVAHLVIELNRQNLQRNYFQRVSALDEQEIVYLEELARTLQTQAGAYRDFVNQLCRYGYDDPGDACDKLQVKPEENKCSLPGFGENCPLNVGWVKALDEEGEKKRYVLAAIVALSNAHRAAARASEIEYRINDLKYRRALLGSENAIAQWDNLIRVPVEQIAAFYNAGVKPEEIGDLIIKALALAGIVVAVENN